MYKLSPSELNKLIPIVVNKEIVKAHQLPSSIDGLVYAWIIDDMNIYLDMSTLELSGILLEWHEDGDSDEEPVETPLSLEGVLSAAVKYKLKRI
jgi:hypothetical protein